MEYVQDITLDLNANTAYTTVGAKQGDNDTRQIYVHITENGADYNLNEHGVNTAYFRFRKPDGKAVINSATVHSEENYISFVLTAQTLAAAGRGYADITLQNGSQILSTVSFILIIMASPQVADQVTSSNEFGYLNAVVSDATNVIFEAEAWAAGTRGGVPVYDQNQLSLDRNPQTFTVTWHVSTGPNDKSGQEKFMDQVKSKPGTQRLYTFTCLNEPENPAERQWSIQVEMINGNVKTTDNLGIILNNSLDAYGIELSNTDAIVPGNTIIVDLREKDLAYENNAYYYAQQAKADKDAIVDLTVSAETIENNIPAEVEKTIIDDHMNFNFKIPKGDTGDVYFMTFDVDSNGYLIMTKPDNMSPQVDFQINEEDGNLYVQINTGGET